MYEKGRNMAARKKRKCRLRDANLETLRKLKCNKVQSKKNYKRSEKNSDTIINRYNYIRNLNGDQIPAIKQALCCSRTGEEFDEAVDAAMQAEGQNKPQQKEQ